VTDSKISGLYRLGVDKRIDELERRGIITAADASGLRNGDYVLLPAAADKLIENVIGVFGLPFAIAPNFVVNGRDRLVPMVVEEPSVVAGLSYAAGLARRTGGFTASCAESLLAGQIHVAEIANLETATENLERHRAELIAAANQVHPRLTSRGGGVTGMETRVLELADGGTVLAVHLLVDTCDAMGANLVNTICEAVAPRIAELCDGAVVMRILSNLADRSVVTAEMRLSPDALAFGDFDGPRVRDAIAATSSIAAADPYRAATHNKGIMNGIDAVAIATGNDWRAIEAGAHAFAAMAGAYRPLSEWCIAEDGALHGVIRVPLKVGIVGASLGANPAAALGIRISGVESALELAELMAAVGLAQNFAALRALATTGIQHGHMRLHARSVAAAAGVVKEDFDTVVEKLVVGGDIKTARAEQIAAELRKQRDQRQAEGGTAAGKVILLGEHAVVYGKHALAVPVAGAVNAVVSECEAAGVIEVPDWTFRCNLDEPDNGIAEAVRLIRERLGAADRDFDVYVRSKLPQAMGLGSSAAFAVAVTRAFDRALGLGLDDERVNSIAFECEKLAHGNPSGVDNTLATFARPMLFRNDDGLSIETLELDMAPPLVVAASGKSGITRELVAAVRDRYQESPGLYESIFSQIDDLSIAGAEALQREDFESLGRMMDVCHGLLNSIGVSTPELERMVAIARSAGAAGAKLTGAGGGGSIVALCPGAIVPVTTALRNAGYVTIELSDHQDVK
jgi:hydroxymethylglutaryl-CoA reductase